MDRDLIGYARQLLTGLERVGAAEEQTLLDQLDQTVYAMRLSIRKPTSSLSFSNYLRQNPGILGRLKSTKGNPTLKEMGTPPRALQVGVLTFLLQYHRQWKSVYEIIETFVDTHWDSFTFKDFERTRTGVMRCFTNTRFAGKALWDHGLILYSPKRRYRTWTLSLFGFVTAAILLEKGDGYNVLGTGPLELSDLDPRIAAAWGEVASYEDFVRVLQKLCSPDCDIFTQFKPVLDAASKNLCEYRERLNKLGVGTLRLRAILNKEFTARMDAIQGIERFYQEFSDCININGLESTLQQAPGL